MYKESVKNRNRNPSLVWISSRLDADTQTWWFDLYVLTKSRDKYGNFQEYMQLTKLQFAALSLRGLNMESYTITRVDYAKQNFTYFFAIFIGYILVRTIFSVFILLMWWPNTITWYVTSKKIVQFSNKIWQLLFVYFKTVFRNIKL